MNKVLSNLNIIWLILILTLWRISSQQCSPSFTLPNIIKDVVSLTYASPSQQSYSYMFFSSMFQGSPVLAYSISQLEIDRLSAALNYYLDTQFGPMSINFYFNAPNFNWTIVSVNFWITSRNDLVITKNTLVNLQQGQQSTMNIVYNGTLASIDSSSTQIIFIVGVYSSFTNNFTINTLSGNISSTNATVIIKLGAYTSITNITILSVIYNQNSSQFLSNSGVNNYKQFSNQFFNLYNNFLPIYYVIVGISSFSLAGNSPLTFQYFLGLSNQTILQASSKHVFDVLAISYLTIGPSTQSVCCGNYFYQNSCIDSCVIGSYPFTFSSGGKACLKCSALAGQQINALSTGCICLPGFQILTSSQCISSASIINNCSGANVIQNGTLCICSPGTYNISGICGACPVGQIFISNSCVCPSNSAFSSISQSCVCNNNFMNISGTCRPCKLDQYYSSSNLTCVCASLNQSIDSNGNCQCLSGYQNISGVCASCPQGTIFSGGICINNSKACSTNQIIQNGICVCNNSSISVGSSCFSCSSGTFANKATNLCQNCIKNCLVCINQATCQQCAVGFVFNLSGLICISSSAKTNLISIRSGYPVYTTGGIITDFILNQSSIVAKSKQQLSQMINIQFMTPNTYPLKIIYSQNPLQLSNIRIVLYYQGLFPIQSFQVNYLFNDIGMNIYQNILLKYQYTSTNIVYHLN